VFLITKGDSRFIIDYTLDQVTRLLDPGRFFRLNRSFIAHIDSIGKVSRYFNGRLVVEIKPAAPEPVYISRARAQEFISWLDR
ncbi:MAG TPA: LytTR family DNA-binding domain-containing protein, partial [Lentimicrobium sp.]|nr:LytTR family DNA-binding domain-containing protein [Lentimicrobium sp.]